MISFGVAGDWRRGRGPENAKCHESKNVDSKNTRLMSESGRERGGGADERARRPIPFFFTSDDKAEIGSLRLLFFQQRNEVLSTKAKKLAQLHDGERIPGEYLTQTTNGMNSSFGRFTTDHKSQIYPEEAGVSGRIVPKYTWIIWITERWFSVSSLQK